MDSRIFFLSTIGLLIALLHGWWFVRIVDLGVLIVAIVILYLVAAWWLDHSRADWWSFAILPTLLNWSAFTYALILNNERLTIVVLLASALLSIFYWRLMFLYVFKHTSYKPFSLERLAPYLSFITVFFTAAAVYGLRTFLNIPDIQLAGILILFQLGLVHQWLWAHKVDWRSAWLYALVFILVITELFFVLNFLPIDFNVKGFMLASVWYSLSGISADYLRGHLTKNRLRLIIGLLFGTWLIVLVTARWF